MSDSKITEEIVAHSSQAGRMSDKRRTSTLQEMRSYRVLGPDNDGFAQMPKISSFKTKQDAVRSSMSFSLQQRNSSFKSSQNKSRCDQNSDDILLLQDERTKNDRIKGTFPTFGVGCSKNLEAELDKIEDVKKRESEVRDVISYKENVSMFSSAEEKMRQEDEQLNNEALMHLNKDSFISNKDKGKDKKDLKQPAEDNKTKKKDNNSSSFLVGVLKTSSKRKIDIQIYVF